MAKNLFDSLSPMAAFAAKLFAAAGLDLSALMAKGDETALKSHLESLIAGAGAKEAIEQATAHLQTDLATASAKILERDAQLSAVNAQLGRIITACDANGIKLAATAQPEAITAAIEARISMRAGEELAKHGLKDFPEQNVSSDPASVKDKVQTNLTGIDRVRASFSVGKN